MSLQEEFQRAQDDALPRESLTEFEGMWVALRGGYVVAANIDAMLLRADEAVRDDDVFIAVPSNDDAILV